MCSADRFGFGSCLVEGRLKPGGEIVEGLLGLFQRDVSSPHQRLGVELAHRPLGFDEGVHQRLGVTGVVTLVVAVTAIADHVDHHVLVKGLAKAERQPRRPDTGFGVISVHVEDRGLHHLGHVRRVHRGTGGFGSSGEPQLVVDHDVDRAAGPVAGEAGEIEGLGHHPLAGKGGVAVEQYGQYRKRIPGAVLQLRPGPLLAPQPILFGTGHAHHHRVHRLQVGGVGGHGDGNRGAVAGDEGPHRALVVLHVAGTLHRVGIQIALEFFEDLSVGLAHDVGQHVEATAVGHAHDGFV